MTRLIKLLTVFILIAIITVGAIVVWSNFTPSRPIEISLPPEPEIAGEIYIGGAVNNPGVYPYTAGDNIDTLLQAAGGQCAGAESNQLQLMVQEPSKVESPQKIDINRAEAWLLQALPGIGETRAQAIIDYRHQNGPFQSINELTKVSGIGAATFDSIKDLITVTD